VLEGLARQAQAEPEPQAARAEEPRGGLGLVWFALGAALAGAAFAIAAFVHLH
jgi:hypothetical protein